MDLKSVIACPGIHPATYTEIAKVPVYGMRSAVSDPASKVKRGTKSFNPISQEEALLSFVVWRGPMNVPSQLSPEYQIYVFPLIRSDQSISVQLTNKGASVHCNHVFSARLSVSTR